MADIFLSYARKNRLSVEPLARQLIYDGWTVWWDPEIAPGAEWARLIGTELVRSRCVLVAWSRYSVASAWVLAEATAALQDGKLVAISIDGASPPDAFQHIQFADLSQWQFERESAGYQQLYAGLRKRLGAPTGHVEESLETVQSRFSVLARDLDEANRRMLAIRELHARFLSGDEAVRAQLFSEVEALRADLGAKSDAFHHVHDMARELGAFMTRRLVATGTSVLSGYLGTLRGLDEIRARVKPASDAD